MTDVLERGIGKLIVIAGPSGSGKGTLIEALLLRVPGLKVSISATTRPPRLPREVQGREYTFLTPDEFEKRVGNGEFLEWAEFDGHMYGTPRHPVLESLAAGFDVILEIELRGARQVLEQCPNALMIFIMPPSIGELGRRLAGRRTQTADSLRGRMARGEEEMVAVQSGAWGGSRQFDYVIVNDSLDKAVDELCRIIKEHRKDDEQADS